MQAAGVLPSVSPVSPDVGMQLPACQPAARLEANQEAALDCAQADAGKRPQAQQIEATPGQANDQQVRYPAYGDGAKLPLSCNEPVLRAFYTGLLNFPQGSCLMKLSVVQKSQGSIQVCATLPVIVSVSCE